MINKYIYIDLGPRHTFSTRLLYTVIPAQLYVGHRTLYKLLDDLVTDYVYLYETGLEVI